MLKICFISFSFRRGGAAKACARQFETLKNKWRNSCMLVAESSEGLPNGVEPLGRKKCFLIFRIASYILSLLQIKNIKTKHSLNLFSHPALWASLQKNHFDILHLHWVNNDTISIEDIAQIDAPVVITLHDEWFYCGAEHYSNLNSTRFIQGYLANNKDVKGVDINRWVWERKKKLLDEKKDIYFTVPSRWLYERAKNSYLLKNSNIFLVPNCIEQNVFQPTPNVNYKTLNGKNVILFGAVDGGKNPIKGFELLIQALNFIQTLDNCVLGVFGSDTVHPSLLTIASRGVEFYNFGKIYSEKTLAEIYSLSRVTIVPSLVESFGQVAAESLACGTPVVAFDYSGVTDIIQHKETGYLAHSFDPKDLAIGVDYILNLTDDEFQNMKMKAVESISAKFSTQVMLDELVKVYDMASSENQKCISAISN